MNMLAKSAEVQCRGPLTKSGIRQPPIRAFMDDLTVTTPNVPGGRWILKGLEELTTWARMTFKPAKSRSLVLKKGKVTTKFHFTLGSVQIPFITDKPVKSLGKVFDCSFLRKWLGLPRSLSSIALYGKNNMLKLPISSLNEEVMVTRTREVLQYRESCNLSLSGWHRCQDRMEVEGSRSRGFR